MTYTCVTEGNHNGMYCVTVNATCHSCRKEFMLYIPEDQWLRWQNGELIQRAIPALSAAERELLISGTCGECFDKLFAEAEY